MTVDGPSDGDVADNPVREHDRFSDGRTQSIERSESLARDLSWTFTDAIYQLERGENFGPELVEISEDEASALIERFREKWEGAS